MFSHHETTGRCGPPRGPAQRRHGFGPGWGAPGEFGGFPFGGGGPGWGPRGRGRGRKARRGDIRNAALLLIAEEPRNGYEIMQEVEERSRGLWRPSPGSVYPALSQLEDEGLIRSEDVDGRKVFTLTDAGREAVQTRGSDRPAPWEQMGELSDEVVEIRRSIKAVVHAFMQVMSTGSDEQIAKAADVLANARRDLYRILAEDDESPESSGDATVEGDA